MARITIDVDLPPEVEITGYQRYQDGHGLEVRWPLPVRCRCEKCGRDDVAHIEFKTIPQAIRDLNLWEQPCFWIYQAPFHRCARCNYRQHIITPTRKFRMLLHMNPTRQRGKRTGSLARASGWYMTFFAAG